MLFQQGTCYWTPSGYKNKDTVWEYYFEPLVAGHPVSSIPHHLRHTIALEPPCANEVGYFADDNTFVSNHFGDHADLTGKTLRIPYALVDPDRSVRSRGATIIRSYVRPRDYILAKVGRFYQRRLAGAYAVGVHARGTDALSSPWHPHRQGSLDLSKYEAVIRSLVGGRKDVRIFVATDATSTFQHFVDAFGDLVVGYATIRHESGAPTGRGPQGWIMPKYVATDRHTAARNGEEAVIDYLLLSKCDYLVHNGASLARSVLLAKPGLLHTNTHSAHTDVG